MKLIPLTASGLETLTTLELEELGKQVATELARRAISATRAAIALQAGEPLPGSWVLWPSGLVQCSICGSWYSPSAAADHICNPHDSTTNGIR